MNTSLLTGINIDLELTLCEKIRFTIIKRATQKLMNEFYFYVFFCKIFSAYSFYAMRKTCKVPSVCIHIFILINKNHFVFKLYTPTHTSLPVVCYFTIQLFHGRAILKKKNEVRTNVHTYTKFIT